MSELKENYTRNLIAIVEEVLNNIKQPIMSLEDAYLYILGATREDVFVCLQKVSNAIPDEFYYKKQGQVGREIQEEIVKDFFLFMAQENITGEIFDNNFANYIYSTITGVGAKYNLFKTSFG